MRSSFLSIAFALVATTSSAAVHNTHVVHEKRDFTPSRWIKRERISPDVVLPLRIALKQRNLHQGYDLLMDVSHPQSANYAKHWTPNEVNEMFSPHQETVDSVYTWLSDFGLDPGRVKHSNNKGWISLDLTTKEAEGLLLTEYHFFESDDGQITPACDSLFAPRKKSIQKRTWYSDSELAKRSVDKRTPKYLQTCDSAITPECIRALYGIPKKPEYQGGPRSDNALGIAEFGDAYAQEDLDLFFANFTPYIPKGTGPTPVLIDGSTAPTNVTDAGGESDLDFDLAYPLVWPQNITLFQAYPFLNNLLDAVDGTYCNYTAFNEIGDDPSIDEPTLNGQEQCGTTSPTNVMSISYGEQEADLPANYQERQCNEFMKLGLQGITIIFASGDSGVADRDGSCLGDNSTIFSPGYPVNCPFVTTVGATKVYSGQTVYDPESAANDPDIGYSSGGGFSNIYTRPSYQQEAVASYFADYDPGLPSYSSNASFGENDGVYNAAGRAYPDVSANGDNIATVNEGEYGLNGGTSASTPIFASLINRINEQRLNANKSTVGFINPALYSNPSMLNDITNGTNLGCNFSTDAFSAVPGWDPVTGLGTPNYPRMLEFFLGLP